MRGLDLDSGLCLQHPDVQPDPGWPGLNFRRPWWESWQAEVRLHPERHQLHGLRCPRAWARGRRGVEPAGVSCHIQRSDGKAARACRSTNRAPSASTTRIQLHPRGNIQVGFQSTTATTTTFSSCHKHADAHFKGSPLLSTITISLTALQFTRRPSANQVFPL